MRLLRKPRDQVNHRRLSSSPTLLQVFQMLHTSVDLQEAAASQPPKVDCQPATLSKDKAGVIPSVCAPILDRLELNAETWLDFVRNFRKRFRNEAGLPQNRQRFRRTRRQARSASRVC